MKAVVEILKAKNLSNTPARREILTLLINNHGPFSAEEISKLIPPNLCDEATLFRTLKQFISKDIVKVVQLDEDFKRYEYNHPNHHHHHIKCRSCGVIETLGCESLVAFENAAKKLGYSDLAHRLEFFGICHKCKVS